MATRNSLAKQLGLKIRNLRRAQNVTLIELSERTGIAQATLSRIETGLMTGTVQSHQDIGEALGVSLAQLYEGIDQRYGKIHHQQAKLKRKILGKSGEIMYELLTQEASQKKLTPFLVTLAAHGKGCTEQLRSAVEKFIFVLDGEVKVQFDGEEYVLGPQDTIYFDGSLPHRISNPTGRAIKFICVISAAES